MNIQSFCGVLCGLALVNPCAAFLQNMPRANAAPAAQCALDAGMFSPCNVNVREGGSMTIDMKGKNLNLVPTGPVGEMTKMRDTRTGQQWVFMSSQTGTHSVMNMATQEMILVTYNL